MKTFEINGTNIIVDESNGITKISISTSDAVVMVNGETVWDKYENPLYGFVPEAMRSFLFGKDPYVEEINEKEILIEYDDISFYFSKNKRKPIVVRCNLIYNMDELINWCTESTKLEEREIKTITNILGGLWNSLNDTVLSCGYKFAFSHSMEEKYYGWWDVIFDARDWDQDKFETIEKAVDVFNSSLSKIEKKYHI